MTDEALRSYLKERQQLEDYIEEVGLSSELSVEYDDNSQRFEMRYKSKVVDTLVFSFPSYVEARAFVCGYYTKKTFK